MNGFAQPVVEKINSRSLYTARSLRGWATITLFNPGSSLFENNSNNNNNNIKTIQNFIQRFKKIDYLQIQEYEILKYIPYVRSSCVRKRIVVKWLSKDYYYYYYYY